MVFPKNNSSSNSNNSPIVHFVLSPANSEEECLRPNANLSQTGKKQNRFVEIKRSELKYLQ